MGGWFRSVRMSFVELLLHEDACPAFFREVGLSGVCEFVDLNPSLTPFQRPGIQAVQRWNEVEKNVMHLRSFCETVNKQQCVDGEGCEDGEAIQEFLQRPYNYSDSGAGQKLLESVSQSVQTICQSMRELQHARDGLQHTYSTALEEHHVLLLALSLVPKKVDFDIPSAFAKSMYVAPAAIETGTTSPFHMSAETGEDTSHLMSVPRPLEMRFARTAGSIDRKDHLKFEKMMYRAVRGNMHVKYQLLSKLCFSVSVDSTPNGAPAELQDRLGFVIFHSSGEAIQVQIKRVCRAFNAKLFDVDAALGEVEVSDNVVHIPLPAVEVRKNSKDTLLEARRLVVMNRLACQQLVVQFEGLLQEWQWTARREKAIFRNMGMLQAAGGPFLRASAWVPTDRLPMVRTLCTHVHVQVRSGQGADDVRSDDLQTDSLCVVRIVPRKAAHMRTSHSIEDHIQDKMGEPSVLVPESVVAVAGKPPTLFRTNKFTVAFQEFVDTYGVARYGEANPALLTTATFPLLFGVMYGDLGHGAVLLAASTYLVVSGIAGKSGGDMAAGVHTARYMLLAMSACGCFCGLLYNDFFSLTLNLFESGYAVPGAEASVEAYTSAGNYTRTSTHANTTTVKHLSPIGDYGDETNVYAFGMDPAWHLAENDLLFFNSFKMKMSVVLGVIQMTGGIFLKGSNCLHFSNHLDLFCEFVPQMLFCGSLFGYLVLLIFIKWSINWQERMALGTCSYGFSGTFDACHLATGGAGENSDGLPFCYTPRGAECTLNTPLVDVCPLDYGGTGDGCQPCNLITLLIDIVLKPGQVAEPLFENQAYVQKWVLAVALVCVPWMLLIKPFILRRRNNRKVAAEKLQDASSLSFVATATATAAGGGGGGGITLNPLADVMEISRDNKYSGLKQDEQEDQHAPSPLPTKMNILKKRMEEAETEAALEEGEDEDDDAAAVGGDHGTGDGHGDEEEFNFSEVFIHQAIETIEFVLGMVSNTASYLRLWALSLAHTELATVFWEKCMLGTITHGNPFFIVIAFAIFAAVTTAVLLFMDVLECFLHALRLHWVEFQNKFYRGDGRKFRPFQLRDALLMK